VTSGSGRASTERTPHPAQTPVKLIDRVILSSSNAGEVILDPFFGSGSTGESAIRNGRYVIGFEISVRLRLFPIKS
jgi:adenine-specific DNA-methyltransferase